MDSYGIYKTACEIIQQAMRDWGYECQGGVEFINYVEGVFTLADKLASENGGAE